MADDQTKTLNGDSTPEERIMARFDALDARLDSMDARLDSMDGRLSALEAQAEDRRRETMPLWEKALADIANVAADVKTINSKLDVFAEDVLTVSAKPCEADARLRDLEANLHRH